MRIFQIVDRTLSKYACAVEGKDKKEVQRRADGGVGLIDLDALEAKLSAGDLRADSHDSLAHLSGGRVHVRDRSV